MAFPSKMEVVLTMRSISTGLEKLIDVDLIGGP
jgi:hypothetical protein